MHAITADTRLRTVVADWETTEDGSVDMQPVVITVQAASYDEAIKAAADKLQAHFGPAVEELGRTDIETGEWFGNAAGDFDPLLRVCAVFIGEPTLDDPNEFSHVIN